MNKICCFAQRQDGYIVGLVKLDKDNKPIHNTSSLIIGDQTGPDIDMSVESQKLMLEITNMRTNWSCHQLTYTDKSGDTYNVFDLDVIRTANVKPRKDGNFIIWVHPWHLTLGPTAELALEIFQHNGTRVKEPVQYQNRTNTTIIP